MDDEVRDLVRAFRAATTSDRDDPTRRAIWHALARETAGPTAIHRLRPGWVLAAAVVAAAALIAVISGLRDDDAVAADRSRAADQAVDGASDAPRSLATRRGGGAATIVPAELDATVHVRPPSAASPAVAPAPTPRATAPGIDTTVPTAAPSASASALEREAALLVAARRAALAHDREAARVALEAHAKQFPRGVLAPERWALSIELWCDAGDHAAAARTAAAFARAYPTTASAKALSQGPCDSLTNRDAHGNSSDEEP